MNKSDLLPIEQAVAQYLDQYFGVKKVPELVLGVSGGADSMCLMHLLHKLGVVLYPVHINYQKRGEASEKDAQLVRKTVKQLGLSCKMVVADPGEAQNKNFQQWARDLRYDVFEEEAVEKNADGIAVAHHQDDQIETILQKLFRGSGLASWSAMEVWDGRLFRPLLSVGKEMILQYCRSQSIAYRTDASNLNSDYARNFLRNEWLPALADHFPGWHKNVLRIAEQATVFEETLQYILKDITTANNEIKRKALLNVEPELQKTLLLYQMRQLFGSVEVSRVALKQVESIGRLQTGKALQLNEKLKLMRNREYFQWITEEGSKKWAVTVTKEELREAFVVRETALRLQDYDSPDFNNVLYLDITHLHWPLKIRNWQHGDRFQPFGMQSHQSVADHLTNRKISAIKKDEAMVIETFDETICAVIFPPATKMDQPGTISEPFRCGKATRQCLTIKQI